MYLEFVDGGVNNNPFNRDMEERRHVVRRINMKLDKMERAAEMERRIRKQIDSGYEFDEYKFTRKALKKELFKKEAFETRAKASCKYLAVE